MMAERDSEKQKDEERKTGDKAGEDEGSAPTEGDDSHLKDDQKPTY